MEEAQSLDRSSQVVKALALYKDIVNFYPETLEAGRAKARIIAITKSRRKPVGTGD